ncbi:glutaminase [uncultured Roseobacter sp.]|uniref:glutaminase n=1 Tax=uncultured Roseobacter sp. TaxID=114847 RepID=UPI002636497F|nr:glutaminase [uncultured Roseobacter sp.]
MANDTPDLRQIISQINSDMARVEDRGTVANYIPQLACVDPSQFGIAVVTADGGIVKGGHADTPFSIQSVSKVFTLTLALRQLGEALWDRVGWEPSGDPFNSIVQLEAENGRPRNPFINAGAIAVTDALLGRRTPVEVITEILQFLREVAQDESISVDAVVAKSEKASGFRNVALANFMRDWGIIRNAPEKALGVYFNHCAVSMSCQQLALAGRYLAWGGRLDPEGPQIIPAIIARRINALMLTCGHYDGSGAFAFRVGLPGKSGVGGGILAIVPGQASIAVWSPGLNEVGNSKLGSLALEKLANQTGWSVFAMH